MAPLKRRVSFIDEKAKKDADKSPKEEPTINNAEVQVDLLDRGAAAKPATDQEESSQTSDGPTHQFNHPLETDHTYSIDDPRNQYVQNNYRAREPEYNRVKPHYASDYRREFSPANSVNRKFRSRSPPSPKTKKEWQ